MPREDILDRVKIGIAFFMRFNQIRHFAGMGLSRALRIPNPHGHIENL
jgi:hypothetical protein